MRCFYMEVIFLQPCSWELDKELEVQWRKASSWTSSPACRPFRNKRVGIIVNKEDASITALNCNGDILCDAFGELALWVDGLVVMSAANECLEELLRSLCECSWCLCDEWNELRVVVYGDLLIFLDLAFRCVFCNQLVSSTCLFAE